MEPIITAAIITGAAAIGAAVIGKSNKTKREKHEEELLTQKEHTKIIEISPDPPITHKGFLNPDEHDIDAEEYWVAKGAIIMRDRDVGDVSLANITKENGKNE